MTNILSPSVSFPSYWLCCFVLELKNHAAEPCVKDSAKRNQLKSRFKCHRT